jgi:histidinol-phosphate aminotransferase
MAFTIEQMRFWSPEVRDLEPYVPGEQPKIQNLLKLNTNENPYPPSPKVVDAVQAVLTHQADALRLYPDPDATVLKQAIAKQQNVDVSQVFVGNGSDEVLAHIFKAFFIQQEPILYPDITYSFYPVYSQFFGVQTKQIPLNEKFEIDISDYEQENGGIIIIF